MYPNQFQDTKQIKFQPTNQNKGEGGRKKYTLRDEYSCLVFYADKNYVFSALFCTVRIHTMCNEMPSFPILDQ